jgi:hypothetical protein
MTYRISYVDWLVSSRAPVERAEYFRTEFEAMNRARQLLEDDDHYSVAVHDGSGSRLTGIRLQLKLGMQVVN